MKLFFICFILFSLFACGTPKNYYKPGETELEYKRDLFECQRDSMQMGRGNMFTEAYYEIQCMQSRGYSTR